MDKDSIIRYDEKFRLFYHSFLKHKLPELEEKRKSVVKTRLVCLIPSPIIAAFVFFFLFYNCLHLSNYDLGRTPLGWICLLACVRCGNRHNAGSDKMRTF